MLLRKQIKLNKPVKTKNKKSTIKKAKKINAQSEKIKEASSKKNILHLGNVGEDCAHRSKKLANMAPHLNFFGIDLKDIKNKSIHHPSAKKDRSLFFLREKRLSLKAPKNLTQLKTNFISGLNKFPDNYFNVISSDFSVGYYDKNVTSNNLKRKATRAFTVGAVNTYKDSNEYTKKTINLIYDKLKPNGKVYVYYFVDGSNSTSYFGQNLKEAFKSSKFVYIKEEPVNISKIPQEYKSFYTLHLRSSSIFRITATK